MFYSLPEKLGAVVDRDLVVLFCSDEVDFGSSCTLVASWASSVDVFNWGGFHPRYRRRWWIWHLSKFESMAALFLPNAGQACLQRSNNHRVREERSADGCQPKRRLVLLWVLLKAGVFFNYIQASLSRWVSEKLQDMTPQQESLPSIQSQETLVWTAVVW